MHDWRFGAMLGDLEKSCRRNSRIPLLFVLACAFSTSGFTADDDYLKSLEAESSKIKTAPGSAQPAVDGGDNAQDDTLTDAQRAEFESYLEEHQKGTFAFYRKLPERSREEVFKSFVDGASMDEIRRLVIDRKMNR